MSSTVARGISDILGAWLERERILNFLWLAFDETEENK